MSSRLKSLTAILLAVLYSLFGLTGESLHYLVEDISLVAWNNQAAESGGFFHSHNPDNYLHFHRSHHHGKAGSAKAGLAARPANEQNKSSVRSNEQFHHQHACPLLTVVSQLKLGQGVSAAVMVESDASHASLSRFNLCHAFELAYIFLARGPPSNAWLA